MQDIYSWFMLGLGRSVLLGGRQEVFCCDGGGSVVEGNKVSSLLQTILVCEFFGLYCGQGLHGWLPRHPTVGGGVVIK